MNSEEAKQSSSKKGKTVVFLFSRKKKLGTRDWPEESSGKSPGKNFKTCSKKKSVSFTQDIEAIPTPKHDKIEETPNKPIKSTEKRLKSCKEHIKTPYSKERVKEVDDVAEVNALQNGGNYINEASKNNLNSAKRLSLNDLTDQPIEHYLSSGSKKESESKKNSSLILSASNQGSLTKNIPKTKLKEDNKNGSENNDEAEIIQIANNEEGFNELIKEKEEEEGEN